MRGFFVATISVHVATPPRDGTTIEPAKAGFFIWIWRSTIAIKVYAAGKLLSSYNSILKAYVAAITHAYNKKVYGEYKFDMAALGIRTFTIPPTPNGFVDWLFRNGDDAGTAPPETPVLGLPLAVGSNQLNVPLSTGPSTGPGPQPTWQLAAGHFETAKIPLEIIAPRAGLSTTNRYYKAYPAIPLRLDVVGYGGAWPYKYELTTAPAGMTIGGTLPTDWVSAGLQNYGEISWPNPTTSGSPHTVAVLVTDQSGNTASVTWTITVTTTGFLFLDSVGGNNANAGTLASPKQNITGWYTGSKNDTTYSGYFVYYRTGSYQALAFEGGNDGGNRMPMPDGKPKVHIAYPGESVDWDPSVGVTAWYSNSSGNIWVEGFEVGDVTSAGDGRAFSWDAGINDIFFGYLTFDDASPDGGTGSNGGLIMSRDNGSNVSTYISFIRCTVLNIHGRDLFLGYDTRKLVAEGWQVSNQTGANSHGFYAKHNSIGWDVRANKGLTGNSTELVAANASNSGTVDDILIRHNNFKSTGLGVRIGPDNAGTLGNIYDERNTWDADYNLVQNFSAGDWDITRNVVRHDGTYTNGYGKSSSTATQTLTEVLAATSGLIDSNGLLTGVDRTNYLGIRGHEVQ